MRRAGSSSIGRKLMIIIMLTTTCALLLASAGYLIVDLADMRSHEVSDLATLASVIGDNASASLFFNDPESATEVLQALRARPSIVSAGIYSVRGAPFARYAPDPSIALPATVPSDGPSDRGDRIEMVYGIRIDGKRIGTIYIASDKRDRNARLKQYAATAGGIVLLSLLIAFVLSSRLQRIISAPIVELSRVASLVSSDKDFSVRASQPGANESDEIGNLVATFNRMLAEIEERDELFLQHQFHLEQTVALRTSELTAANEKLLVARDVAEKVADINARMARQSALILNSATDGIIGLSIENRATFLNPAGARILGMTLEDFEGKTIHQAIHHSFADGAPFPEEDCENTKTMRLAEPVAIMDDTFWRPDGTSFPVEYSSRPMFDENGKQLGAVMIFRDVTERRAIERMKSQFVSTVSHELRTPLTSIRGALGLLTSGLLGPIEQKGQRMLEIAVSNTDRLVRLINDILDLERIDSGKVELARARIDATAVMVQAMEGIQSMADQAGVRLAILPEPGMLWGDSDRIIQTLTNLLGNAIKFSLPGTTVTLSGTARQVDFLFCVADQGRGIPEDKLESIFERFIQVDASDSRDKGGSGLGLAICQSIVVAHGGRIWAERNEPVGSRVQFTLPIAVPSIVAVGAKVPSESGESSENTHDLVGPVELLSTGPSVLVVEDNLDLARVMTTALHSHGIRTLYARTGAEAIRLCVEHEPNLIVLDFVLPDMDGFAVVSALRQRPARAQIPLLVYSALDVVSADQLRLRLGPTEFLTKSRSSLADFEAHVLRLLETVADADGENAA